MEDVAALKPEPEKDSSSFDSIGAFARTIFDTFEAGIGIVDAETGRYVFVNARWCKMLGYEPQELSRLSIRDVTHPDDWPKTEACIREAQEGLRETYFVEKRFLRKNKTVFWGFLLVRSFRDPVTGNRLLNGIILDFDDKKRIEFQLLNERNITRALSEINALILKRPSPEELYRESCRIAVEFGGFMASWVAVVDPLTLDTHKSGLYIKDPRVQEGIDRVIISVDPEKPNGRGSVGQAYRSGKPVVLNDYLDNPSTLPWRTEAEKFGVASASAFPIRKGEEIVALLVILSNRPNFFETESIGLLTRIAEAMSYALDDFERGQDLFLTSLVFDAVPEGIFITDVEGRITRVNEAFCRLSGFSFGELLGREADTLTAGLEKGILCASIRDAIDQRGTVEGIFELIRKDASSYMVEATITLVEEPGRDSRHVVLLLKDVTAKMERERQIWRLANIDDLTGLLNRTALIERLANEMEKSRRNQGAMALLFLDFDDFKGINDTLGHSAGDSFLKVIGHRLSGSVRPTDIVARLGGDEFVVVVSLESDEKILSFAQKILDILGAPVSIQSQTVQTSVSVGIATYPRDAESVEDLLRKADIAMYQAKNKGKNTWQFFNVEMEERIRLRFEQEQMLKTGLQEGAFFLHFQPQIDVFRRRLVGVEALARSIGGNHRARLVHSPGGRNGNDPRVWRVGDPGGVPGDPVLVGLRKAPDPGGGQCLLPAVLESDLLDFFERDPVPACRADPLAHVRIDGNRPHARSGDGRGTAFLAQGAGHPHRDRRFRDGVFFALLSVPVSCRRDQGLPGVCHADGQEPAGPEAREDHHPDGQEPPAESGGRRGRNGRGGAHARGPRVPCHSGIRPLPAASGVGNGVLLGPVSGRNLMQGRDERRVPGWI
ncbi:diguanylate cyclase/phosphodiesterase (GGDEF & EAL domains) with PAS/PAC sensor(s) [Leptospirillum ferriphilum]|nr:diguanylate cyclase [Leptospirillum ferriphilum]KGA94280.1 diguanylate cyclase/phosphodiesterase (GGDEF & EAL domains) with PAS/PAC sensor(s) [Leptospirillum ferriphilum]